MIKCQSFDNQIKIPEPKLPALEPDADGKEGEVEDNDIKLKHQQDRRAGKSYCFIFIPYAYLKPKFYPFNTYQSSQCNYLHNLGQSLASLRTSVTLTNINRIKWLYI